MPLSKLEQANKSLKPGRQELDDFDHLILASFMRQPSNQLYLFAKQGSGTHINMFSP
jgi:hypothetical protein